MAQKFNEEWCLFQAKGSVRPSVLEETFEKDQKATALCSRKSIRRASLENLEKLRNVLQNPRTFEFC